MHKITKGLKKKKKGKKSKHKEEELFKPEELEAYRREHQAHPSGGAENEEWKKFHALTSGVDNVLQKTQEELSRIKETSFFQRVVPPSEKKRKAEEEAKKDHPVSEPDPPAEPELPDPENLGIVQVSDSESEADDEDDDIFDTAYINAIAAGEVKLAYIPESPTEIEDNDPFDTSYAEKAILGPAAEKGRKLVPIGAAVEVLTGRVQLPTCSTQRPSPNRRQVFKERNLLLGSFDDNANSIAECIKDTPDQPAKTLLDEEAPPDLASEPIDLTKSLYIPPIPVTPSPVSPSSAANLEDSEDDEFAQLATENLNKEPKNVIETLPVVTPDVAHVIEDHWNAFDEENIKNQVGLTETEEETELDVDPFDTTFAENILPGKAELKQIESEILNAQIEYEVKPKQEKLLYILKKLSVSEDSCTKERITDSSLQIKESTRDLLGGSNTDLNSLNQPLTPAAQIDDNYIEYCDPFDTSIVETVKKPGQAELKFIEKELLEDIKTENLSDDDFNPRAEEIKEPPRERSISRPDVLNVATPKSVCFDATVLDEKDFIGIPSNSTKLSKPPTPFYVRKNSVPGSTENDLSPDPIENNTDQCIVDNSLEDFKNTETDLDPFDTSIANNVIY